MYTDVREKGCVVEKGCKNVCALFVAGTRPKRLPDQSLGKERIRGDEATAQARPLEQRALRPRQGRAAPYAVSAHYYAGTVS